MDAPTAERVVRYDHRRAPAPVRPRTCLEAPADGPRLAVIELPGARVHAAGRDGQPACGWALGRLVPTMLVWSDGDPGLPQLCPRCQAISRPFHVSWPPLPAFVCPPPATDAVRWWLAGNRRAEGWGRLLLPGIVYLWAAAGLIGRWAADLFAPGRFATSVAGLAVATAIFVWSARKSLAPRIEVTEDGMTLVDDRRSRRWSWSEICQFESTGRSAGLVMRTRSNEVVSLQLGVACGSREQAAALNQAFGLPRDAGFLVEARP
jgi:hypothetical protein